MGIIWPDKYSASNTSVHVSNELEIPAPAEVIWAWLIHASLWPEWYPTVRRIVIEGASDDLGPGTKFSWRIFEVNMSCKVEEFVPNERLAWSAHLEGVDAYHVWLIEKRGEGCRVLTEENQKGWLARLNNLLRPSNVGFYHRLWLEALSAKAKGGYPPDLVR